MERKIYEYATVDELIRSAKNEVWNTNERE
jgi:hypothetical protein